MNNILVLKGKFEQKNGTNAGPATLPVGAVLNTSHIDKLIDDLKALDVFWKSEKYIDGALISVRYTNIVSKTRRIKELFAFEGKDANSFIVGAKYNANKSKHIITYYISKNNIITIIERLELLKKVLIENFDGSINDEVLKNVTGRDSDFKSNDISKSKFGHYVSDAYNVEEFDKPSIDVQKDINDVIVSLYKTDDTKTVLEKLGINTIGLRIIDDNVLLTPSQLNIIKKKAPYLIAMISEDMMKLMPRVKEENVISDNMTISLPKNEPTIGVIDTPFDKNAYFSDWVDDKTEINDLLISDESYDHGTMVDSIIVDGPSLNKELDDGCGHFKVRHFGLVQSSMMSSFQIMRNIQDIVKTNNDIHVWNLSLGQEREIDENFISVEASILDKIQKENNVIFVIAGTNKKNGENNNRIGAPADCINGVVVNAVDKNGNPPSYARSGPVLSFFNKPDISCFGGDVNKYMTAWGTKGKTLVKGTSFATPWIARKLAYLIDVLGISMECAKALLIDSAAGWDKNKMLSDYSKLGYGIVPTRIEDIINTPENEIRFIINGVCTAHENYNYDLPVPISNNKFPYVARAVLCYFPRCNRSQGVDYTNTELEFSFGRLDSKKPIKTINENYQSVEGHFTTEEKARQKFRKWDNTKRIVETFDNKQEKSILNTNKPTWGISIRKKERLNYEDGKNIKFGLVVTLRDLTNKNRIDTFVRNCRLYGWHVNSIIYKNQIDIYNKAEEEIRFE